MPGVVLRMLDLPLFFSVGPFRRVQKIAAGKEHIDLQSAKIAYRLHRGAFHLHGDAAVRLVPFKVIAGLPVMKIILMI